MIGTEDLTYAFRFRPELDILKHITLTRNLSGGALIVCSCLALTLLLLGRKAFAATDVHWHHGKATIQLRLEDGKEMKLSQLCQVVASPGFRKPWLYNTHMQTLMYVFGNKDVPLYFWRMQFESDDSDYSGTFEVDFSVEAFPNADPKLPPRTAYYNEQSLKNVGSDDSRPMLVALHGLCGGSHEPYLQSVIGPLISGKQKWESCVLLSRGCGESSITGGGMYYAHATSDLRQLTSWLKEKFPNRPLFAVGFSMGANILTRYIAEQGEECPFRAAVVISNPWNLELAAVRLQKTFFGRWVYSPAMTANLMDVFRKAKRLETVDGKPLKRDRATHVRLLHEYDRYIQCPTWGFPTERVYYRQASSSDSVLDIKIPFWAINAEDDPIVGDESIPKGEFQVSPYTIMCTTDAGGHLGWIQTDGSRWYAKPVVSFFKRLHNATVHSIPE